MGGAGRATGGTEGGGGSGGTGFAGLAGSVLLGPFGMIAAIFVSLPLAFLGLPFLMWDIHLHGGFDGVTGDTVFALGRDMYYGYLGWMERTALSTTFIVRLIFVLVAAIIGLCGAFPLLMGVLYTAILVMIVGPRWALAILGFPIVWRLIRPIWRRLRS